VGEWGSEKFDMGNYNCFDREENIKGVRGK
jgi:hypothetical protein